MASFLFRRGPTIAERPERQMSSFPYPRGPTPAERLNRRLYTPAEQMELHMKYEEAAAPTTPQGVLEVKVKFLDEIASKARSLIAERANLKSCDLQCAQLIMYVMGGLADVHRHHEDIGPHIMELLQTFDDIKSIADGVLRLVGCERCCLSKVHKVCFIAVAAGGTVGPSYTALKYDSQKGFVAKLMTTFFKGIPFLSPIMWDILNGVVKKDKNVCEEIQTTVTWIQKAAALVYRVLDEDILPAIPPPIRAPTSPSDHAALPTPPDTTASPSYHTPLSTPDPPATPSTSAARAVLTRAEIEMV